MFLNLLQVDFIISFQTVTNVMLLRNKTLIRVYDCCLVSAALDFCPDLQMVESFSLLTVK